MATSLQHPVGLAVAGVQRVQLAAAASAPSATVWKQSALIQAVQAAAQFLAIQTSHGSLRAHV
jgi:hypothetical protein